MWIIFKWVLFLLFGGVGVFSLIVASALFILKHEGNKMSLEFLAKIRDLSTEALIPIVFNYDPTYFTYIGEDHPAVIRFRELITQQDAHELEREWDEFYKQFTNLEHKKGWRGRPYILDFYCNYDLYLKVFNERSKNLNS